MNEFIVFVGLRCVVQGSRLDVLHALRENEFAPELRLVFNLETGAQVDFDLTRPDSKSHKDEGEERARGRPKLGVVAREVTLLPRHWDWLNAQRGGASAALRRLVDAARRADGGATEAADARAAAYRMLSAIAGDWPNFEEAARALFADDFKGFATFTAGWPGDVINVVLARWRGTASALSA